MADISEDKWVIKIREGFGTNKQSVYPSDRLVAFLNFNPKTKREAGEFCTKYQIIPPGLDLEKDNILEAIEREQNLLKPIAQKIVSHSEITVDELNTIRNKISVIRKSLTLVVSNKLNNTNKRLSPQTTISDGKYGAYFVNTSTHGNTTASLWEELANNLVKWELKICINCGAYFQPKSNHNRKFCDNPNCSNAYRQRKARKLKK